MIIGGGPAGLMAAEVLGAAGVRVLLADQMPSVGRKFLMAGKSGLNLTKHETAEAFASQFHPRPAALQRALDGFGPVEVMAWAEALGQEVFTGSTGRVFPTAMKASPLLRAWLRRLADFGVELRTRWRWEGWQADGALRFATPDGPVSLRPRATVLALGGASWARLGADGAWVAHLPGQTTPFAAANMGFCVQWSAHMARFFGAPLKSVRLMAGRASTRGECVITPWGIEGGGIYSLSRPLREGAPLTVDLCPDLSVEQIAARLVGQPRKATLANRLRRALRFDPLRIGLLQECGRPLPADLAPLIKALPVPHQGPRPLDEAISTAGGLCWSALDGDLMLHARPGVFAAGEMLDWEAPTGGYLITGCLATGRHAGLGAVAYLRAGSGAARQ